MLDFFALSVLPSLETYQYKYKPGQSLGEGFLYQESAVGRVDYILVVDFTLLNHDPDCFVLYWPSASSSMLLCLLRVN